jgi:hypothetical protein
VNAVPKLFIAIVLNGKIVMAMQHLQFIANYNCLAKCVSKGTAFMFVYK